MLTPAFKPNDKLANRLIILVSLIVFIAIVILSKVRLDVELGFDEHLFASINAVINSMVSILLVVALWAVKMKKYVLHKNSILLAIILSVLFLMSYIAHHLFAGETKFGGEGAVKTFYLIILFSHILLAGIILPFILYTAYRGLTGQYVRHKKLARYTWPLWLYVSITGVIVYLMISPYYT